MHWKGERFLLGSMAALLLVASLQNLTAGGQGAPLTRGYGEDLMLNLTLSFNGPTDYVVQAEIGISIIEADGAYYNASQIREGNLIDPSGTQSMVVEELNERVMNLTSTSFSGDSFTIKKGSFRQGTLSYIPENDGKPVVYDMTLTGITDLSRFLDADRAKNVQGDRQDELITALFSSGFTYRRTVGLRAEEGCLVVYRIPKEMDIYEDGKAKVLVVNTQYPSIAGLYNVQVDGTSAEYNKLFDLTMRGSSNLAPSKEDIDGRVLLDWSSLDQVSCTVDADITALSSSEGNVKGSVPQSMTVPQYIGPGLVRICLADGLLGDQDLSAIEKSMAEDASAAIEDALSQEGLDMMSSIDMDLEEFDHPENGQQMLDLLTDQDAIKCRLSTLDPVDLDILEGYSEDDVMGLLNGGLRIFHQFDQVTDERFETEILMPPGLTMVGARHLGNGTGGRELVAYEVGMVQIASRIAPVYESDDVRVRAEVNLSDVRSDYMIDSEVNSRCSMDLEIGAIKYYPGEMMIDTPLEFELDYLNADMIRLVMKMGIVPEGEIIRKIEEKLQKSLDSLIPKEGQTISISIVDGSKTFDGDFNDMAKDPPLQVHATLAGQAQPFGGQGAGRSSDMFSNVFVPFHLDPLVPWKTVKRSVDMGDILEWDVSLRIVFPSGVGVKAWMGNGSDHYVRSLEVRSNGAYPTLYLDSSEGGGDHIYLELGLGGYYGFNNVLACFATTLTVLVLLLLIVLLLVLKGIKKRRAKRKALKEGADKTGKGKDAKGKPAAEPPKTNPYNWAKR